MLQRLTFQWWCSSNSFDTDEIVTDQVTVNHMPTFSFCELSYIRDAMRTVLHTYKQYGPDCRHNINSFQVLLLVFKCICCSHLVPSVYIDRFVINSEVHNYNTRSSQNLHLFSTRTSYGQKCIKDKGSLLWNSLPIRLRLCSSISVFKRLVKNYLRTLWYYCNLKTFNPLSIGLPCTVH